MSAIDDGVIYRERTTAEKITDECNEIRDSLLTKNRKYGDSVFNEGIAFRIDPIIAIKARINDKISRLREDHKDEDEDIIIDLIGYLILYRIAQKDR